MSKPSTTYQSLHEFIQHQMRMAALYQPVMLRELLKRKGKATITATQAVTINLGWLKGRTVGGFIEHDKDAQAQGE